MFPRIALWADTLVPTRSCWEMWPFCIVAAIECHCHALQFSQKSPARTEVKIYREEEQKRRGSNIDQIRIATDPDHLNRRHFLLFSVFGLDDSPVINSQLLIGHCSLDKSVTSEKQWNLIVSSKARHVTCFCHFIASLWWHCLWPGQKKPISNGRWKCWKLISMQSVDVIWQLQCWPHCHVLVTVTILYCFGRHWPACYMELMMILVMVWRSRVMMGIAILEHFTGTNAIVMIMELIMRGQGAF